ncbi:MAG: hypothetical protein K6E95_03455 [Lachnospiraceae bacterium]|nr:hypothetical protein [Lachnospiraceae bacterium]
MNKQPNSPNIPDSYMLYSGRSLIHNVLEHASGSLIYFLFIILFERLTGLMADSPSKESTSFYYIFYPVLVSFMMMQNQFTKEDPGGKLFRTIKGGFATYVRYHIGLNTVVVISAILFSSIAVLLGDLGLISINNGITDFMKISLSCISSLTIFNMIFPRIMNKGVLIALFILSTLIISMIYFIIIPADKITPYIVICVAEAVLLPLSILSYVRCYKRKYWT